VHVEALVPLPRLAGDNAGAMSADVFREAFLDTLADIEAA